MDSPHIVVIAHNIRSSHNIGSIFRTCEGFGVEHLYLSGYSPYPKVERDTRLPHIAEKVTVEIAKTALGAEKNIEYSHIQNPYGIIDGYKVHGYEIIGLEQEKGSIKLPAFSPPEKVILILGEEVEGIPSDIRRHCDSFVEIPMSGKKESFNVSVATGIALYALRYSK